MKLYWLPSHPKDVVTWIQLSLAATVFLTGIILFLKCIGAFQLPSAVVNFYFFFSTSLLFLASAWWRGDSFALPKASYWMFGGLALVALGYNDLFVRALGGAPNPAYPQAIVGSSVVIIALFGVLFFGAEFHLLKLCGVFLIAAGVAVVSLAK